MKLDRITFLFLSLLILATALVLFLILDGKVQSPVAVDNRPAVGLSQDYQIQVRRIFDYYLSERIKLEDWPPDKRKAPWIEVLDKIRDDFLNLKLSSRFQKEHLSLILQIDKLRQNLLTADWEKAQDDERELLKLFSKIQL